MTATGRITKEPNLIDRALGFIERHPLEYIESAQGGASLPGEV